MSSGGDQPRCPECGNLIGRTSTYCIHCSADLTDELEAADENDDFVWDQVQGDETDAGASGAAATDAETAGTAAAGAGGAAAGVVDSAPSGTADTVTERDSEGLLDPDGLVDNSLTIAVGILAGIVAGSLTAIILLVVTGSGWGFLAGILAWLGVTAYLARRKTVQGAIARGGYAVAAALLLVPLVALSPVVDVDGGIGGRLGLFGVLLLFVAVPASVAGVVGWIASKYVPDAAATSEG